MCDRRRSTDLDEVWHVHCRNVEVLALQVMTLKRYDGKGINTATQTTNGKDGVGTTQQVLLSEKNSNIAKTCAICFPDKLIVHFFSCC